MNFKIKWANDNVLQAIENAYFELLSTFTCEREGYLDV